MQTTRRPLRWSTLALAFAFAGCAGSGEGLDANGRPLGETGPGDDLFTQIQESIFTAICTACHAGASAPLGLRLDAASSFAMLVGVPSVEVPTVRRVAPGDPDASYLVQKIEGRAAVGGRMPLGGPPLTQTSIDLVRQWIAAGAPPPTGALSEPLQMIATIPAQGERVSVAHEIVLVFSQPIDASIAQAGVFTLRAGAGDEIALASMHVSAANPTVVRLVPVRSLTAGVYRLDIRGAGPTALADVHAHTLRQDHRITFTVIGSER